MRPTNQYFSPDYSTARQRFRAAVQRSGGHVESLELDARGPKDEPLTIDTAWFGPSRSRRALVHSSGLHGVEGFAGSAIQLHWLQGGILPAAHDTAIVLVHVLNPYGMAWLRRFNENNVDLNRNFLADGEPYAGAPEGYRALDSFLNPATPPSPDFFYMRAGWQVMQHGLPTLRQAVAGGQYTYPKGLFFGGQRLEAGPAKLQAWLADRLHGVERIVAIDIHTGLGPFGQDRLLVDAAPERAAANREMQMAFGERVQLQEANLGVAYKVRGGQHSMYFRLFPTADVHFASQEFGTYNPLVVVKALRAENRWHHYGDGAVNHPTRTKLRKVFCPGSERWRQAVLQRGSEVVIQAQALLGR